MCRFAITAGGQLDGPTRTALVPTRRTIQNVDLDLTQAERRHEFGADVVDRSGMALAVIISDLCRMTQLR
jgi:hypothetical protein